jgi:hypothetical protein
MPFSSISLKVMKEYRSNEALVAGFVTFECNRIDEFDLCHDTYNILIAQIRNGQPQATIDPHQVAPYFF